MNLQIAWDDRAGLTASVSGPLQPLGWYLSQDVQADAGFTAKMLSICEKLINDGGEWTGSGNAHLVEIKDSRVRIQNLYVEDEGACEMGLQEFYEALKAWLAAIRSRGL